MQAALEVCNMFNITQKKYLPENTANGMTRDKALGMLKTELEDLKDGVSHPETAVALFIHCITVTKDPTLLDLATEDIKSRIYETIKSFEAEGYHHFYNSKGELIDDTPRIKSLSDLLRHQP
jgi:hypothetical protein